MIEEGVPRGGSVGGLVTYWFLLLKARPKATMIDVGEWRSMVARYVRDAEVDITAQKINDGNRRIM